MEQYNKIQELVATMQADIEKFNTGNNAAGSRVRKSCQEIKKLAQDIRKVVQEQKIAAKAAKS